MYGYSPAELGLVSLCTNLGDPARQPLSPAAYRHLAQRVRRAIRPAEDRDLCVQDLVDLGYDEAEAGHILRLLDADPQPYLRQLERNGITLLTKLSERYPQRLRTQLGSQAPLVLYASAGQELASRPAVSVVGSRDASPEALALAAQAGRRIAALGYALCTGGAKGVDSAALASCLDAGGSAVIYLPEGIRGQLMRYRRAILRGQLLLLSSSFEARFHPAQALERNQYIHAHGRAVIVCQCQSGHGGSWRGSEENLRNHWSQVFVPLDGSEGTADLLSRGASPLDWAVLQTL